MKKFVKAVIITTILAIITRALGLIIKIYLSRKIGAEAIGYYQIALSVFFLLCSLVTSGIPLIISRHIAKKPTNANKIVFSGLIVSSFIAFIVCSFVVIFPFIFSSIWKQDYSLYVLFSLLPAVVFTGLYIPFRGAFWGNKQFFELGFVELVEQLFRFFACLIIFALPLGIKGEVVAGITYSIACGLSSIFAIIWYFVKGGKIKPCITYIKPIIKESAPIAIMRIGSSLTTLLISILVPMMLVKTGLSQNFAVGQFGIVTGMVLPLLTIPGTIISSISVALIPDLSAGIESHIKKQVNRALSYSIIISFILLPTFLILGKEIGVVLYNDHMAGSLLSYSSFLLIPLGLSQISSSILNAINKENIGLINYIIGAVLLLVCVVFLPTFMGIYSLIVGFFVMSLVTTILNLFAIKKYLSIMPLKTLLFSLIYSFISALFAHFSFGVCSHFTNSFISVCIAGGLSVGSIILLYQIFNFIDIKDFLPQKQKNNA